MSQTAIAPFEVLIRQAWTHLGAHWNKLAVFAGMATALQLVAIAPLYLVRVPGTDASIIEWLGRFNDPTSAPSDDEVAELLDQLLAYLSQPEHAASVIAVALISIVVYVVIYSLIQIGLQHTIAEQSLEVKTALQRGVKDVWKYWWVSILASLAVLGGLLLLVIPGIIAAIWFAVSDWVVLLEDKRGVAALKQSRRYVQGRWWGVVGRSLLFGVLITVVAWIIELPIGLVGMASPASALVLGTFANCLMVVAAFVFDFHLYTSLKQTSQPPATSSTD